MKYIQRYVLLFWIALCLLLITAPGFAQDADEIILVPFTSEVLEISGTAPEDWEEVAPGTFSRQNTPDDGTVLVHRVTPLPPDALMEALIPQLGFEEIPESAGTYASPMLDWSLYQIELDAEDRSPATFGLAVSRASGKSFLVILVTDPGEFDTLYEAVFLPALDALAPLEAAVDSVPYVEQEVTFDNGEVTLAGTLTLPASDGPHPAVVLVTGSGAQDRDESLAPAAAIKPFRLIADHLTRHGIAVLRYDDRGAGLSTGDYFSATGADFASDASAAVAYLLSRDDINPEQIGVLGHSEGGGLAPMIAVNNPDVAFVIAMAGYAVSGFDVLVVQNERILLALDVPEEQVARRVELASTLYTLALGEDEEATRAAAYDLSLFAIQMLPEEDLADSNPEEIAADMVDQTVTTVTSDWFRYFLEYNPAEYWEQIDVPVLALFGELDVQVDSEQNAPMLEAVLEQAETDDVTIVVFPTANHLFQDAVTGSIEEYSDLKQEFLPEFLPTITDWLLEHVDIPSA